MNCSKVKTSIQDFINDDLDEKTESIVRSHLDSCPHCNDDHEKYTTLVTLLHDSTVPLPTEDEWNSIHLSILENLPEQQLPETDNFSRRSLLPIFKAPVLRIAAALLVAAVSVASFLTYLQIRPESAYPKVVAVNGNGQTVDADKTPVNANYTISPGNAVETDKNTSLEIQVDKKSTLEIGSDSRCKVAAIARKKRIFQLQKGDLAAKVSKRKQDELFRIETPNAYCEVIGTRFNVTTQYDNYSKRHITTLLVEEGSVEFGSSEHNMPVKAGYAVAIFGDSLGIPTVSNDTLIQLLRKQPGHGAFAVTSIPPGADVYIDGEIVGKTPLFNHAPFGKHAITVSKSGFGNWTDSIEITAHKQYATEVTLTPGKDGIISPEDYLALGNHSLSKAVALMKVGNRSKAIAILNLLVNNPSIPPVIQSAALYKLATCHKLNRNYETAVLTLSRIFNGPFSSRERGKALFQCATINQSSLHNYPEAIKNFKRYTTQFPKGIWYEEALYSLSELYYYTNNFKNAAKYYTTLINTYGKTPHREKVLFTLGTLYSNHLSNVHRGLSFYNRLLHEFPNSSYSEDALFWSASCLLRQGLSQKSSETYKSYLKRFPKGKWHSEASQQLTKILSVKVD